MKYYILPEYITRVFQEKKLVQGYCRTSVQPEISRTMSVSAKVFWLTMARSGEFPVKCGGYTLVDTDGDAALYRKKNAEDLVVVLSEILKKDQEAPSVRTHRMLVYNDYSPDNRLELLYEVSDFELDIVRELQKKRSIRLFDTHASMKEFQKTHPLVLCRIREWGPDDGGLWDSIGFKEKYGCD